MASFDADSSDPNPKNDGPTDILLGFAIAGFMIVAALITTIISQIV